MLPEFFTSAMAFNPVMEKVAQQDRELDIPRRFSEVASRYGCILAGSYLRVANENVYNTMLLQFPDGSQLFHDKDIPTQFENCYFTCGDRNRAKGAIGVALCWEMLRTQTIAEMPAGLKVVAAGSCWWDISDDKSNPELRRYNHRLSESTPARFARLLGVPVIHAAHVGKVVGFRNSFDRSIVRRQLIGSTRIIDHRGNKRRQLEIADGDAILMDEVELPPRQIPQESAKGFWTVEFRQEYLDAWKRENRLGQAFYSANRQRMVG